MVVSSTSMAATISDRIRPQAVARTLTGVFSSRGNCFSANTELEIRCRRRPRSPARDRLRRILRHRLVRCILPDLHAEMQRNPQLANDVRSRLQIERRRRAATVIERAIARGDVPATVDDKLFNDAAGGLLYALATGAPTMMTTTRRQPPPRREFRAPCRRCTGPRWLQLSWLLARFAGRCLRYRPRYARGFRHVRFGAR